ncbi:MAG: hypothetical protein GH159_04615 [Dehalococcoidia bacterium]|nr:hypothetical protein [Dehalococcoidia bacterium]
MIINEFLDLSALLVPERTAIAFEGRRYSYAELKSRVNPPGRRPEPPGLKEGRPCRYYRGQL